MECIFADFKFVTGLLRINELDVSLSQAKPTILSARRFLGNFSDKTTKCLYGESGLNIVGLAYDTG